MSKEAWAEWLEHQTMLINEYRLTPIEPKARKFLEEQMEKFFFSEEGSDAPNGICATFELSGRKKLVDPLRGPEKIRVLKRPMI